MAATRFARRALGLIALGVAAFTVYGSLVPFNFRARTWPDASNSFLWAMQNRWWIESRSDGLANVILGIPLGFGLFGFLRTGTTNRLGDLLVGAMLLPGCLFFATAVEFSQLYVPERTCAGSDVLCQAFGAILGMMGWLVAGRGLMRHAEDVWNGADAAGRLVIAYLVLLAFVQLLPMDLSPSPRDLYRKLRDKVVYVPFAEFRIADGTKTLQHAGRLMQVFGLYVPIGLLARFRIAQRESLTRIILLAIGIALAMESLQLIVHSRSSSATDVVIGTAGSLAGWWLARAFAPLRFALGALWFIGMAFVSWQPFIPVPNPPLPFDWIPGMPLEGSANPIFTLEDMLTKLVLFALGGSMLKSIPRAAVAGLVISGVFEAGQTVFESHTPCITDVLLGALGAAIGSRVRLSVDRREGDQPFP